jgi:hypothetical protein
LFIPFLLTFEKTTLYMKVFKDQHLTNKSEALFGREAFIDALVNFIVTQSTDVNPNSDPKFRNQKDNLTIGLYGKWGMGKTSIIHSAKNELAERGFLSIYFDPWLYKSEDLLIYDLFKSILNLIGKKETGLKEKAANFFKKYAEYITLPKIKFKELELDASDTAKNLMKGVGEFLSDDKTIDYYKEQINTILNELANPVTIFIDDIDRLNKDEIQVLFKTIRLIADFNNIIYVLSFDDEMVAKSVKDNFASGDLTDGFSYLEKIIQIPLRVPEIAGEDLFGYTLRLAEIPIDSNNQQLIDNLKVLFLLSFKTPRDCKRFVNSFNFTFYNLKHIEKSELFLMELIRIKIPKLFTFIQNFNNALLFRNPSQNIKLKALVEATEELYNIEIKTNPQASDQFGNISKITYILLGFLNDQLGWAGMANEYKKRLNASLTKTFYHPKNLELYFQFKKDVGEI